MHSRDFCGSDSRSLTWEGVLIASLCGQRAERVSLDSSVSQCFLHGQNKNIGIQ